MEQRRLNLPPIKLKAQRRGESITVWDDLRKKYVVLTPEEWVRQHVISYLIGELNIPPQQIIVEYPVELNGQSQRADIVVVTRSTEPHILVECKAPEVKISQSTLDQAVRYNSILSAKYIMLTNGLTHHLYERISDEGEYRAISNLPTHP